MDRAVLELVSYYQNEVKESEQARSALSKLGITAPEVVDHFGLGYCSGKALSVASDAQYEIYKALGLASRRRESFHGCIVIPVFDGDRQLVDLCGIKQFPSQIRFIHWQKPLRGLIGFDVPKTYPELILTDSPLQGLHVRQHGHANVVALRSADELGTHLKYFDECAVRRVYVLSRKNRERLSTMLGGIGVEVVELKAAKGDTTVSKETLAEASACGVDSSDAGAVRLESRHGRHYLLTARDISYRVESLQGAGLDMRVKLRADRGGVSFIDQLDMASAGSRQRFSRLCGTRIGVAVHAVESHVDEIAELLDTQTSAQTLVPGSSPLQLTDAERDDALGLLREHDLMELQAKCLEESFGFVAEPEAKRLILLVAASRLLPQPLGAVVRGAVGSGKSTLIRAAAGVLQPSAVIYVSRITPQALYFMPPDSLSHRLLVCDEYEGIAGADYPLRSMMSNQKLSLAVTTRESGRTPVTRQIDTPATVAVLVSSTRPIAVDNLSRFLEVRLDESPEQTRRVMQRLASGRTPAGKRDSLRPLQVASELLRPCSVRIPFSDALSYESRHVLARRQFAAVVGLISAHAALCQYQRKTSEDPDAGFVVEASLDDYAAVYPLLSGIIDSFEEDVSPDAERLLAVLEDKGCSSLKRCDVMQWLGWSYSKTYSTLRELALLDLLVPDSTKRGVERVYEVTPFHRSSGGISRLTPPESVGTGPS